MGSSWFPAWLGDVFAAAFALMLVAHVVHAAAARGWACGWHGAHVLMAAGMLDMTWPGARMPVSAGVAEFVFWVAALGGLIVAVLSWTDWRRVPWAWFAVAVDLGAMAYMFALPAGGHRAVTLVLTGWLVVESAAWTSGLLQAPGHLPGAAAAGATVPPASHPASVTPAGEAAAAPMTVTRVRTDRAVLAAVPRRVPSWSARASLSAMGLGMAYMLLAMQFGMSGTGVGGPADPSGGGGGAGHHHHGASAVLVR